VNVDKISERAECWPLRHWPCVDKEWRNHRKRPKRLNCSFRPVRLSANI